MEILRNIDPAHLPYIAVACALLCVSVIIIGFVLQAVSSIFEVVFRFLGPEVLRKVALDAVFFLAAEGRVGEHNVHPVLAPPADIGPRQGVS